MRRIVFYILILTHALFSAEEKRSLSGTAASESLTTVSTGGHSEKTDGIEECWPEACTVQILTFLGDTYATAVRSAALKPAEKGIKAESKQVLLDFATKGPTKYKAVVESCTKTIMTGNLSGFEVLSEFLAPRNTHLMHLVNIFAANEYLAAMHKTTLPTFCDATLSPLSGLLGELDPTAKEFEQKEHKILPHLRILNLFIFGDDRLFGSLRENKYIEFASKIQTFIIQRYVNFSNPLDPRNRVTQKMKQIHLFGLCSRGTSMHTLDGVETTKNSQYCIKKLEEYLLNEHGHLDSADIDAYCTLFRFYAGIILDPQTLGADIHCNNIEERFSQIKKHYERTPQTIKQKLPDIAHLIAPKKITFQGCCHLIDQASKFERCFFWGIWSQFFILLDQENNPGIGSTLISKKIIEKPFWQGISRNPTPYEQAYFVVLNKSSECIFFIANWLLTDKLTINSPITQLIEGVTKFDKVKTLLMQIYSLSSDEIIQEFRFKACRYLRTLYEQGLVELEDSVIADLYSLEFYADEEILEKCYQSLYEEKMSLKDAEKMLSHIINNPKSDLHKSTLTAFFNLYQIENNDTKALEYAQKLQGITREEEKTFWRNVVKNITKKQLKAETDEAVDAEHQREQEERQKKLDAQMEELHQQQERAYKRHIDQLKKQEEVSPVGDFDAQAAAAKPKNTQQEIKMNLDMDAHPAVESEDLEKLALVPGLTNKFEEATKALRTGKIYTRENSKMTDVCFKDGLKTYPIWHDRLNDEHRIFYVRIKGKVIILQAYGHDFNAGRLPKEVS